MTTKRIQRRLLMVAVWLVMVAAFPAWASDQDTVYALPFDADTVGGIETALRRYRENPSPEATDRLREALADLEYQTPNAVHTYERLVEEYDNSADPLLRRVADTAFSLRIKFADGNEEAISLYEERMGRLRNRAEDELAKIEFKKAWLYPTLNIGDAMQRIIDKYGASSLESTQSSVVAARLAMAILVDDRDIGDILSEIVIRHGDSADPEMRAVVARARILSLQLERNKRIGLFTWYSWDADSYRSSLGLVLSERCPTEELANLFDSIIVDLETSSNNAAYVLFGRADMENNQTKKRALLTRIVTEFTDTNDSSLHKVILYSYELLADLTESKEEKIILYDTAIKRYMNSANESVRWCVSERIYAKRHLTDDSESLVAYYRFLAENASTNAMAAMVMFERVRHTEDRVARASLLNELIEKYHDSRDIETAFHVSFAVSYKARREEDKSARIALLESVRSNRLFWSYKRLAFNFRNASLKIIALTDDVNEKIRLYDESLRHPYLTPWHIISYNLFKCKLLQDREEKRRIYEKLIADYRNTLPPWHLGYLSDVYIALADIQNTNQEKLELYNVALDTLKGETDHVGTNPRAVLGVIEKKAELFTDPNFVESSIREAVAASKDDLYRIQLLDSYARSFEYRDRLKMKAIYNEMIDAFQNTHSSEGKIEILFGAGKLLQVEPFGAEDTLRILRLAEDLQDECDPSIRELVASMLASLAKRMEDPNEAKAITSSILERYGEDAYPYTLEILRSVRNM